MPRLYRPAIPLEIKCRVALRQLGRSPADVDAEIERHRAKPQDANLKWIGAGLGRPRGFGALLDELLPLLADALDCPVEELRLDHHPALENRRQFEHTRWNRRLRRYVQVITYEPDANSLDDLIYRTKHAHHIKTNVRGDGAQFADNVIAKRERKRARKRSAKPKRKMSVKAIATQGRPSAFGRGRQWPRRALRSRSSFR